MSQLNHAFYIYWNAIFKTKKLKNMTIPINLRFAPKSAEITQQFHLRFWHSTHWPNTAEQTERREHSTAFPFLYSSFMHFQSVNVYVNKQTEVT